MSVSEPDIPSVLQAFNHLRDSMACPIDEGDVFARVNYDGEIETYCLSCSWGQVLGLDARRSIVLNSELLRSMTEPLDD